MTYLIVQRWKLPTLASQAQCDAPGAAPEGVERVVTAACRDCGHYNFPPKSYCRYCGSLRLRTVVLAGDMQPHPGTLIFGSAPPADKPN